MREAVALQTERLTLALLLCGVAALALSDFVSPIYWLLPVVAGLLRFWRGPAFHLSEMQASFVGWFGFGWVILELLLGRALVVAFTDFLLILSLAVVVEASTPRNHLHRMLVGLFLLLAAAVLTDSLLYAVPLIVMSWLLWRAASALYATGWQGGDLAIAQAGSVTPRVAMVLMMTLLLFMLLPRFEFHSLLKAKQPRIETSGFSDLVRLGEFARELDGRIAFRVEVDGEDAELIRQFRRWSIGRYWRGTVLSQFTGSGWQKLDLFPNRNFAAHETVRVADEAGMPILLYREATDHAYLPLPDGLVAVIDPPERLRFDAAGRASFIAAPSRRLRLQMEVSTHQKLPLVEPLHHELRTDRTPESLRSWLQERRRGLSPAGELEQIVQLLKGWEYDLQAPIGNRDPIGTFLQLQRGHCELYASVVALVARELGLPARVINGYRGGDWNEVGNFVQIRHLHAHSWTEVWLGDHWRRFDATPPTRDSLLTTLFPTVEQVWESLKLGWYRYVLEFQDSDRAAMFRAFWLNLVRYGEWLLSVALALLVTLLLWRKLSALPRIALQSDQHLLWPYLDRWLKKHGVERKAHQSLCLLQAPEPIDADAWQGFVAAWERQCYGDDTPWSRRDLKRHLRALLKRC